MSRLSDAGGARQRVARGAAPKAAKRPRVDAPAAPSLPRAAAAPPAPPPPGATLPAGRSLLGFAPLGAALDALGAAAARALLGAWLGGGARGGGAAGAAARSRVDDRARGDAARWVAALEAAVDLAPHRALAVRAVEDALLARAARGGAARDAAAARVPATLLARADDVLSGALRVPGLDAAALRARVAAAPVAGDAFEGADAEDDAARAAAAAAAADDAAAASGGA